MHDKKFIGLLLALCIVLWLAVITHAQQTPTAGDLVINEIMYNPSTSEPGTEWFEVKNITGSAADINGCTISSGSATHTIASAPTIAAGDYFVFGRNSSITGVTVDYSYGGSGDIRLNNSGSDDITITCNSTTIDSVTYGTSSPWPSSTNGTSISFGVTGGGAPDSQNDNASNWGHSTSTCCSGSDKGTPGAKNDDVLGATVVTLLSLSAHSTLAPLPAWPLAALAALAALALVGLLWARRRRLA